MKTTALIAAPLLLLASSFSHAAKTYPYDPVNARKWIQTLPQGPVRTKTLQTIYQGMPKDSDAAKEFASEYGIIGKE
jgi:Skp family chaperone for outer membrane proteins